MDIVCFRDACDGDVPDNKPSPSGTLRSEREEGVKRSRRDGEEKIGREGEGEGGGKRGL